MVGSGQLSIHRLGHGHYILQHKNCRIPVRPARRESHGELLLGYPWSARVPLVRGGSAYAVADTRIHWEGTWRMTGGHNQVNETPRVGVRNRDEPFGARLSIAKSIRLICKLRFAIKGRWSKDHRPFFACSTAGSAALPATTRGRPAGPGACA